MKRFVFSLSALLEMKQAQKVQLQKEYAQAKARLDRALCEKDALDRAYRDETERYEQRVKKGITAGDIKTYAAYFMDFEEKIKSSASQVARAQEEAGAKQKELVEIFKEVKSLEKLREKQYEEYRMEEGKQETKLVDDILAFKITGGQVAQTAT